MGATKIRAITFARTGGPEVLEFGDIDLPPPAAGEARVRHTAIGVNFIETYHRGGLYPVPLPSRLGQEAAGVIEAVGEDVTDVKPGDRVAYAMLMGAYAEATNVAAARIVKLPDAISDEVAAASLLKGMTAEFLLNRCCPVKPGQTIVFHAAAGGVGLIAGQWAAHLGATVIGTVGSDEKIPLARQHGYAHVFNTRSPDWAARVREVTGGNGVPVVFDSIGKDTFEGSLDCLAMRGTLVSFGSSSGPVPPLAPLQLMNKGSLFLTRPALAHYIRDRKELQDSATALFGLIANGTVTISIGQRFKLADAAEAHRALEARATTGATILLP